MSDMDSASLTRDVYRKLTDAEFRHCLKATDSDGSHPITIAQREELVRSVLERVRSVGGVSNIVVPASPNGYVVIAIEIQGGGTSGGSGSSETIRDNCTLGVFLERMTIDGAATESRGYRITTPDGSTELEHGSAALMTVGA